MQNVSAEFTAMSRSAQQHVCSYLEIAWDPAQNVQVTDARGAPGWYDETSYLLSFSGKIGLQAPGEALLPSGDEGRLELVLDNAAGRYSWRNSASPLYAYISGPAGLTGRPVRLWQGFRLQNGAEYVCIFTGITTAPQFLNNDAVLNLSCMDWSFRFLQGRYTTTVHTDLRADEFIALLATQAGLTLGQMDYGIYPIPYVWLDDESVQEIFNIAAADGGVAWFDQRGRLIYTNPLTWAAGTPVLTLDEGEYTAADPQANLDAVATKIIVEWSTRYAGVPQVLYTLTAPKQIMPGLTETWTARFQYPALRVYTPERSAIHTDYSALTAGGMDISEQLTIALTNVAAQQAHISVTNNSHHVARLIFLQLRGVPLLGGPTEQEVQDVTPPPYPFLRTRNVRGNVYLQTAIQGKALAALLALRCRRLRPIYRLRDLNLPQIEIGDRVAFYDRRLHPDTPLHGIVLNIGFNGDQDGFWQELMLLDVSDWTVYGNNYFRIGDVLGTKYAYY